MYIAYWFDYYPGDSTGLAAAYQEFAAMDPATAYAPELVDALLEKLAPEATALARQGDVAGAAAALREQLDPYPGLEIDVEAAADRISQDASTGSLPVEGAPSTAAATGAGDTFGATPLALGDTVVGTIAPNTADTWSFTGNAGATITIDLAANGSDWTPISSCLAPTAPPSVKTTISPVPSRASKCPSLRMEPTPSWPWATRTAAATTP